MRIWKILRCICCLGCNQKDEEEVLQLGGGDEPPGGQEPQETITRQRCQAKGGQKKDSPRKKIEAVKSVVNMC